MIERGYIDACILASYYCPELISDDAEKLLLSVRQPVISLLTEIELFAVVSKKIRKKELTKRNAQQIIENYNTHIKEGFYHKISVKTEHYLDSRNILSSLNCSLHTLDTLHLAITISEKIPLITADKKFAKVAKKMQLEVICL